MTKTGNRLPPLATALITRAASGTGRELTIQLGREGCAVGMIDVDADRLARAAADVDRARLGRRRTGSS